MVDLGICFPKVDRIWGIWGPYYNIPKAIFYLLQGDYRVWGLGCREVAVRTAETSKEEAVAKVASSCNLYLKALQS